MTLAGRSIFTDTPPAPFPPSPLEVLRFQSTTRGNAGRHRQGSGAEREEAEQGAAGHRGRG